MTIEIDNKHLESALRRLKCLSSKPTEDDHSDADDIVRDLLKQMNLNDIADAYDNVGKWYA